MSEISRFYGIIIRIYFLECEHNPPHIHAIYNDYMASINIKTLEIIQGELPQKAINLVREWIIIYRNEIEEMWSTQKFKKIPPLK